MRWLLAVGGALALLATAYFALRPRLTRPVLRVGLALRAGYLEDEAVVAGFALALEDRDERGGRFRVEGVGYPMDAHGVAYAPTAFKIFMPGLQSVPAGWAGEGGISLIAPDLDEEADLFLAWVKARGLHRVAVPASPRSAGKPEVDPTSKSVLFGLHERVSHILVKKKAAIDLLRPEEEGLSMDRLSRWTIEARPDLVLLDDQPFLAQSLREAGFDGPIFLAAECLATNSVLDGCLTVLAPLKAPPPGFGHPSPFAYAGYLAALRYLDVLDRDPAADPEEVCLPWIFDELRGEPRVYELRASRFIPK